MRTRMAPCAAVSALLLISGIAGCSSHGIPQTAERLAARLRNDDVRWEFNCFTGLSPTPNLAAEELISAGARADDALLRALSDPARFGAAHVVLTMIHD